MSDECLIASEQRFPYCTCCQAVTRKFTLVSQALNYFGSPLTKGRPVFDFSCLTKFKLFGLSARVTRFAHKGSPPQESLDHSSS